MNASCKFSLATVDSFPSYDIRNDMDYVSVVDEVCTGLLYNRVGGNSSLFG